MTQTNKHKENIDDVRRHMKIIAVYKRLGTDPFLSALRKNQLYQHLNFRLVSL